MSAALPLFLKFKFLSSISFLQPGHPLVFLLEHICWLRLLWVFLHLRISLVHLHFWRIFLLGIEFWFGGYFHSEKMLLWCLLASVVSKEFTVPYISVAIYVICSLTMTALMTLSFICRRLIKFVFRPGFLFLKNYYSVVQRRQWHPTPVLLPGKSHGWRSLVGSSPWGCEELDMTERPPFQFSLSCIGEGTGNPLQCSCLENPRDRGACWAAVCVVAQSDTTDAT